MFVEDWCFSILGPRRNSNSTVPLRSQLPLGAWPWRFTVLGSRSSTLYSASWYSTTVAAMPVFSFITFPSSKPWSFLGSKHHFLGKLICPRDHGGPRVAGRRRLSAWPGVAAGPAVVAIADAAAWLRARTRGTWRFGFWLGGWWHASAATLEEFLTQGGYLGVGGYWLSGMV